MFKPLERVFFYFNCFLTFLIYLKVNLFFNSYLFIFLIILFYTTILQRPVKSLSICFGVQLWFNFGVAIVQFSKLSLA